MTTAQKQKAEIFMHSRSGGITEKEYFDLQEQLKAASERDDDEEFYRISSLIPIRAEVAKAFKTVYGREYIISNDFDVTEANMKYGEGWLDEDEEDE